MPHHKFLSYGLYVVKSSGRRTVRGQLLTESLPQARGGLSRAALDVTS
jgi:hypothetical protein